MVKEMDVDSFLDEEFLRKLEQLRLLAQRNKRGSNIGEHLARKSGTGLEFLDYRNYQIGDDLRYVDWNVYGRLDKLFIKLFNTDRDITIHILVDMSNSMDFGTPVKTIYAKKMVAALSYIGLASLDNVGITSFGNQLLDSMTPEKGRQVYLSILQYLHKIQPEGPTDFNHCLTEFSLTCKKPGVAIILSDLLDPKGIEEGLNALKYTRFDTTVIQILDHIELFPEKRGTFELEDVETKEVQSIPITPKLIETYKRKMEEFLKNIKNYCIKNQIDYHLFDTQVVFEDFLLDYLSKSNFIH